MPGFIFSQLPIMQSMRPRFALVVPLMALTFLAGCVTRPINARIDKVDPTAGYRFSARSQFNTNDTDTIIILAFSGGGTRAAAFSYGVLEELRRTELVVHGRKTRMLDEVDVVTGVSGGSFTELAAQLYDEILFHGATFADLQKKPGPWAVVTATDISTGSRLAFVQTEFD